MCDRRALRALGVVDVADSALITRGASEPSVAKTSAGRLSWVRCDRRCFAVAVRGRRALRARGVSDVTDSALITSGAHVPSIASTLA